MFDTPPGIESLALNDLTGLRIILYVLRKQNQKIELATDPHRLTQTDNYFADRHWPAK